MIKTYLRSTFIIIYMNCDGIGRYLQGWRWCSSRRLFRLLLRYSKWKQEGTTFTTNEQAASLPENWLVHHRWIDAGSRGDRWRGSAAFILVEPQGWDGDSATKQRECVRFRLLQRAARHAGSASANPLPIWILFNTLGCWVYPCRRYWHRRTRKIK